MSYWDVDDKSFLGLKANFEPKCMFCDSVMGLHNAKLLNFDTPGNDLHSHAIDVETWCPGCGHLYTFGVAISKEHFEKSVESVQEYKFEESEKQVS